MSAPVDVTLADDTLASSAVLLRYAAGARSFGWVAAVAVLPTVWECMQLGAWHLSLLVWLGGVFFWGISRGMAAHWTMSARFVVYAVEKEEDGRADML